MAQPKKSKIRELAMQILFLWDTHNSSDLGMARQVTSDATDDPQLREAALEMASAAWEHRQTADRWVERVAPQWPPHRQPAVDRNVLRMAVWELVNSATPPKVVIDEAIELAKHFSTEQSASFVNGVMDAILKEHRTLTSVATLTDPPA